MTLTFPVPQLHGTEPTLLVRNPSETGTTSSFKFQSAAKLQVFSGQQSDSDCLALKTENGRKETQVFP